MSGWLLQNYFRQPSGTHAQDSGLSFLSHALGLLGHPFGFWHKRPPRFKFADHGHPLHHERLLPLRVFHRATRAGRQLQDSRALAFAQLRQQDDLSVGELKGIMMNV